MNQVRGLPYFATQADENVAANIRMGCKAREDTAQLLMIRATFLHSAAPLVGKRKKAIYIWILIQYPIWHSVADVFAGRCRTIHRADNSEIVPGPDPSVGPGVALEGNVVPGRRKGWLF